MVFRCAKRGRDPMLGCWLQWPVILIADSCVRAEVPPEVGGWVTKPALQDPCRTQSAHCSAWSPPSPRCGGGGGAGGKDVDGAVLQILEIPGRIPLRCPSISCRPRYAKGFLCTPDPPGGALPVMPFSTDFRLDPRVNV